jgi:hypothetical protein
MQKTAPCNQYQQRETERESEPKSNCNAVRETVVGHDMNRKTVRQERYAILAGHLFDRDQGNDKRRQAAFCHAANVLRGITGDDVNARF